MTMKKKWKIEMLYTYERGKFIKHDGSNYSNEWRVPEKIDLEELKQFKGR